MKASRSIVNSRRERILETVRSEGDVTVSALAEQLQVSPLTIRRDLQYLEEHKLLERFYGGARTGGAEEARKNSRELRKERIARYAASLVEDGVEAKLAIQDGLVKVNGEVDTRRGRKLYPGDLVTFEGNEIKIDR